MTLIDRGRAGTPRPRKGLSLSIDAFIRAQIDRSANENCTMTIAALVSDTTHSKLVSSCNVVSLLPGSIFEALQAFPANRIIVEPEALRGGVWLGVNMHNSGAIPSELLHAVEQLKNRAVINIVSDSGQSNTGASYHAEYIKVENLSLERFILSLPCNS